MTANLMKLTRVEVYKMDILKILLGYCFLIL